ncbi:hypothetical protein RPMA_17760 [Tardiphaga alba]|uniref:Autotransporter outer membrane beta-barrel domain-containing protein n=1 Tax=Tardiphaga alba TaxID=340268 RepID=A0ABX8AAH9_9BRAD|nr:hypothetical protein [Tardiphaga alba]QUS40472.1 hypothetical protein RPMA_17760 [Tardiphaga alba]
MDGAATDLLRRVLLASTALVAVPVIAILGAGRVGAQELIVNGSNSPYAVTSGINSFSSMNISGTVNQSGGTLDAANASGNVYIGSNTGAGTLNLSGGTFSAGRVVIALLANGSVNQTGGTFISTGGINIGTVASGSYTISGAPLGEIFIWARAAAPR